MKKLLFSVSFVLTSVGVFAGTAPETLSVKGTALKESNGQEMPMKKVGNTFELYTAMEEGGQYSFVGDNVEGGTVDMVFGEGDLVPFRIRVNYDGDAPEVTVEEIDKVTVWTPWSKYTVAQLNYAGNSKFASTDGHAFIKYKWGDDRYRIKIFTLNGEEETYGRLNPDDGVGIPEDTTPQSYYDLVKLAENGDWFDGANEFKIGKAFQSGSSLFNFEVILSATENYTHKQIRYEAEDPLPLSLTIEGSAVEGGKVELQQTSEGIFEYIGGLQNGTFKMYGEDLFSAENVYYSITADGMLRIGDENSVTTIDGLESLTPHLIRINIYGRYTLSGKIEEFKVYRSSETKNDNAVVFKYIGGQKFSGIGEDMEIPAKDYGRDDRYKFLMKLDNEINVEYGKNVENAGVWVTNATEAEYFKLYPTPDNDTDDYHYVYTWNRDIFGQNGDLIKDIKMDVSFVKNNYSHSYAEIDITGVKEEKTENGTFITPTIAKDYVTVTTAKAGFTADVISMTGACVVKETSSNNSLNLNVSHLPAGMYLVRVSQGNNSNIQRFIKQ